MSWKTIADHYLQRRLERMLDEYPLRTRADLLDEIDTTSAPMRRVQGWPEKDWQAALKNQRDNPPRFYCQHFKAEAIWCPMDICTPNQRS